MELAHLPETLRVTAELVGLPGTLKLVERYGGVRIYVPQTMHASHPLAELLGMDAAVKLSLAYGGIDHFDVPRCLMATRRVRDAALVADFLAGTSHRDLAFKYAITERGVRKIIARAGITADDRQPELF